MSLTVVVGGQFGSEGKGKLVAHLAAAADKPAVVRCGGTNSGHTVDFDGRPYPLRQLPSGAIVEDAALFLGAGMVIAPDLLLQEISDLRIDISRVRIDRNAVILDESDREAEKKLGLRTQVGSTLSGTGSATARKVLRDSRQQTARDVPEFRGLVTDVSAELNALLDAGRPVIVEGTQGMGLSLHHSPHFPFVTGRDTSAAAFLSEVGLSPMLVSDVVLVLRTFPIRVAGNSGPLRGEITWKELTERAGAHEALSETTTVTRKIRRVAEFDWEQAEEAVRINRPSAVAIHGIDYLNFEDRDAKSWSSLSQVSKRFIHQVEARLDTPVDFVFTGPAVGDLLDRRLMEAPASRKEIVGASSG